MVFAQKLREFSQALGISDAEVARRLGISGQRYGHYVSGRNQPDLEMLLRMCRVLAATPNEMLGYERNNLDEDDILLRRITAAAQALSRDDQRRIAVMIEALANTPDILQSDNSEKREGP